MLILTRHFGEKILIRFGDVEVWLTVAGIDRNKVRLGFEGPPEVKIHREELLLGELPGKKE